MMLKQNTWEICFFTILMADKFKLKATANSASGEIPWSMLPRWLLEHWILKGGRGVCNSSHGRQTEEGISAPSSHFIRSLFPSLRTPLLWLYHLVKGLPINAITIVIMFQLKDWGNHVQNTTCNLLFHRIVSKWLMITLSHQLLGWFVFWEILTDTEINILIPLKIILQKTI
jgi:hypothetical protein